MKAAEEVFRLAQRVKRESKQERKAERAQRMVDRGLKEAA
jgi:hypothetical protein